MFMSNTIGHFIYKALSSDAPTKNIALSLGGGIVVALTTGTSLPSVVLILGIYYTAIPLFKALCSDFNYQPGKKVLFMANVLSQGGLLLTLGHLGLIGRAGTLAYTIMAGCYDMFILPQKLDQDPFIKLLKELNIDTRFIGLSDFNPVLLKQRIDNSENRSLRETGPVEELIKTKEYYEDTRKFLIAVSPLLKILKDSGRSIEDIDSIIHLFKYEDVRLIDDTSCFKHLLIDPDYEIKPLVNALRRSFNIRSVIVAIQFKCIQSNLTKDQLKKVYLISCYVPELATRLLHKKLPFSLLNLSELSLDDLSSRRYALKNFYPHMIESLDAKGMNNILSFLGRYDYPNQEKIINFACSESHPQYDSSDEFIEAMDLIAKVNDIPIISDDESDLND